MKHLCSYCGGWESPSNPNIDFVSAIKTGSIGLDSDYDRDICIKCLVKGYDKLFGSLDKCDKCGEKVGIHHICVTEGKI